MSISVATFVPKPFTPFQWAAQNTYDEIVEKQSALTHSVTTRKISIAWHEVRTSVLEGVIARGDRRLGKVLELAFRKGAHLDAWSEYFALSRWEEAFAACGLDPAFYANRVRPREEILPWSMISCYVSDAYLWRQRELAYQSVPTPDCRTQCSGCGANVVEGGECSRG